MHRSSKMGGSGRLPWARERGEEGGRDTQGGGINRTKGRTLRGSKRMIGMDDCHKPGGAD